MPRHVRALPRAAWPAGRHHGRIYATADAVAALAGANQQETAPRPTQTAAARARWKTEPDNDMRLADLDDALNPLPDLLQAMTRPPAHLVPTGTRSTTCGISTPRP
jgi:hypothetical protein